MRVTKVITLLCLSGAVLIASQQQPQFRASVDVVELNVAVFDGRKVVPDLAPANFEVLDNGVRQQVLSVTRETMPIDVTMVIDVSESVTEPLLRSMLSAVNRIRERLRPSDRVSLITFNHRMYERVALLPPPAVKAIEIGRPSGQTSLNDAIAVALAKRAVPERRQMLIVFTDGFDSTSLLSEEDVLTIAGRSSAAVFTVAREIGTTTVTQVMVGGQPKVTYSSPETTFKSKQPVAFFEELASVTGGFAQMVPAMNISRAVVDSKDTVRMTTNYNLLDDSFIKALEDFRSSYVLRYNLSGVTRSGWHTVVVNASKDGKKFTVRTRRGYVGGNDAP